jgi:glycosyltransferase involved in cell wall biosynthesis
MAASRPTISVLIPSYGRPARLTACLRSLDRQTVPPDEVLVVWQADDTATRDAAEGLAGTLSYRLAVLHSPEQGVVPAENLALDRAGGDVIALIDDDAVAPPGWVERHLGFYADPTVGAVGGPADNHHQDGRKFDPVDREPVGRLTWFGRQHGNMHTQPAGWRDRPPAAADSLVGYNLTLRRAAFDRFEAGLRRYWQGFELDACLQVAARGYRVLFDFANVVDHFPTNPTYAPGREGDLRVKVYNGAYNHAFVLAKHSPFRLRAARLAYLLAVGSTATPGLLGAVQGWRRYGHARREAAILMRTWAATAAGWRDGARRRGRP